VNDKILDDKAIGELWLSFVLGRGQQTYAHNQRYKDIAAMLIHKLVEEAEQALMHTGDPRKDLSQDAARYHVLKRFNIPEEDWK